MKYKISDFLSLSSSERKGAFVLVILILVVTGIRIYVAVRSPHEISFNDTALVKELALFEQQLISDSAADKPYIRYEYDNEDRIAKYELFYFDPNTVSSVDIKRLGLDNRLVRTMISYRFHGGKFYETSDLKKIYGFSEADFLRLAPYVKIATRDNHKGTKLLVNNLPADINKANSEDLESVDGIGEVLSQRIIRYRDLLGGFYDTRQLGEVYGLPDSVIVKAGWKFYADSSAIRRLNINVASESELARHPYIGSYLAKGIISYRKSVNRISDLGELNANGLISEEEFKRLKHYLEAGN